MKSSRGSLKFPRRHFQKWARSSSYRHHVKLQNANLVYRRRRAILAAVQQGERNDSAIRRRWGAKVELEAEGRLRRTRVVCMQASQLTLEERVNRLCFSTEGPAAPGNKREL